MKLRFAVLLAFFAHLLFAQDLQQQARAAVLEKRFEDALVLYGTLLKAAPADVDYMLWMARLSAWNGDSKTAAVYYVEALALQPDNVDALVGRANLLMWKHSFTEAAVLLTRAQELASANTDVELAWSRFYHWQGDDAASNFHVSRVLELDRENAEALRLREQFVPDHSIELRIAYQGDTLPGASPGALGEIGARYLYGKGEIGVTLAELARYGGTATRGGLHFSRALNGKVSVHAAALFGTSADIAPRFDLSLGLARKLPSGFVLGADYRHLSFRSVRVDSAAGSLDYYFEKPVWLQSSYAANWLDSKVTSSVLLKANAQIHKRLTANLGYGRGTEVFQLALPTELGSFNLDNYLGGVAFSFTKKTRLETNFVIAKRSTGDFQNTFVVAIAHLL